MAVYMVMFMGMNPTLMPMSMMHDKRRALVLSLVTFALLAAGILVADWGPRHGPAPGSAARGPTSPGWSGAMFALGQSVMGPKMLVMMGISAVMAATIVAALVIASARGRYDRFGDELGRHRRPRDPQPGGVGRTNRVDRVRAGAR